MPAVWGVLVVLGLDEALAAALGASIIAAAAALAVFGQQLARKLPWPLSLAANGISGAISLTIIETVRFTVGSAQGLANAIQAPWQAIWTVARSTVVATEQLAVGLLAVVLVDLPKLVSWTQTLVQTSYLSATAYAHTQAAQVAQYAAQLVLQAEARADAEFVTAVTHSDAVGAAVARYAHDLVQAEVARADAEFLTAEQFARAAAGEAIDYAHQLAGSVLEYVEAADHTLELQVERVLADATDYARALERIAVDHADAAAAATGAAAAAATGALAARVSDIERSDCMKVCSPLGAIGGLLQALGDASLAAVILAMAAELASDPRGAAAAIDAVAGGPVRELVGDLGGEIGQGVGSLAAFTRVGGPALHRG
jgi:hypothetical protein